MRLKLFFLISLPLLLSGCGRYDCNSPDVHQEIIGMLARNSPAPAVDAYGKAKFSSVVTIGKNSETGRLLCKADISVEMPDGHAVNRALKYTISRVESDDADFKVSVDDRDFSVLRWDVNVPINQDLAQQAQEQKKAALAAEYVSNPPVAIADAVAAEQIKAAIDDLPGGFDVDQYHLIAADLNNDTYREFIALWRDTYATANVVWHVKVFSQVAREPGGHAELEYSRESMDDLGLGHAVNHYELNGNVLTVSDGAGWSTTRVLQGMPINPHFRP